MLSTKSSNLNLSPRKSRGRPKKFDYDLACSQALELFWTRGYEGTSISDLSEALNMNRPSMYASFGNKETLFNITLSSYLQNQLGFVDIAIKKPTLSEVLDAFFIGQIDLLTRHEEPRGCLLVQAAASCSEESEPIKDLLIQQRKAVETKLRKRIQLAQLKKDFPTKQSPSVLAKSIMVIYEGISIQAASGSAKKELVNIAELSKKILS